MNSDYLRVFRAFSDERRIKVLELLMQGEQCACTLLENLDISQPTLSYHMKILCRSGIVRERSVGPWKYYSMNAEGCDYAVRLLQALSFSGEAVNIRLLLALAHLTAVLRSSPGDAGDGSVRACPCCTLCPGFND